ncbi:hypothetical protein SMICM17S_10208 [Streptomyces microflavus]
MATPSRGPAGRASLAAGRSSAPSRLISKDRSCGSVTLPDPSAPFERYRAGDCYARPDVGAGDGNCAAGYAEELASLPSIGPVPCACQVRVRLAAESRRAGSQRRGGVGPGRHTLGPHHRVSFARGMARGHWSRRVTVFRWPHSRRGCPDRRLRRSHRGRGGPRCRWRRRCRRTIGAGARLGAAVVQAGAKPEPGEAESAVRCHGDCGLPVSVRDAGESWPGHRPPSGPRSPGRSPGTGGRCSDQDLDELTFSSGGVSPDAQAGPNAVATPPVDDDRHNGIEEHIAAFDGYVLVRPAVCGVPGGASAVVGVDACLGDDVVVVDVGDALLAGTEVWQVGDQRVPG